MSRKDKKEWTLETLLSVVGFVFELLRVVVNALRARNGTVDDLRRLIREPKLVDEVFDLIINAKTVAAGTFHAMCDYDVPTYQALNAQFDWVNDWYERMEFRAINICKSVSREPRELEFVYVHMGRSASTDEVLAEMEKRGLRPAIYEEGLVFAKAHPDEQRKFPVVALGSICVNPHGYRSVACLVKGSDGRSLNLHWIEYDWSDRCRFLAVSK